MNYPRIIAKVYAGIWALKPDVHHSLCATLEARLDPHRVAMPMPMPGVDDMEDPEDDDMPYRRMSRAAVIPVHGILGKHLSALEMMCGGCDCDMVADALSIASEDGDVDRIILDINSPGGIVTGIPELAAQIAEQEKPIYAFGDNVIASAAYWLASQTDGIYTTGSMDIGSVGVYSLYLDESRALENEGLKVNAISAGKYKLMGASFKPMTDDERRMLQADIDRTRDKFRSAILSRRRIDMELMEGQCFDGEQAASNGYSDGVVRSIVDVLEDTAR